MDISQINMQDPRVQAMLAELIRKQQGGAPMQQQETYTTPLGTVAPAIQPNLQTGPQMPPPGATPPPQATQPPGAAPGGAQAPAMAPPGGAQLDPNMVEAVIGLQGQRGQREGLERQYALADAMRADSQRQLQQRIVPSSTGGMVVAPNWANALSSVAGSYMANKRSREADTRGAELDKKRQDAQREYFNQLTGQMRKRDPRDDLGGWGSLSDY